MENKELEQPKSSSKKDAIYITIIILLLLAGGYFGWEFGKAKKEIIACDQSVTALQEEKDYLNEILVSSGIISDADNQNLKSNLQNILAQYDSLEIDNDEMLDSINAQKSRIQDLMAQVEEMDNQKKKDWGQIYKLKKETETLREIMRGYIHTIDSLNTLNIELHETIKIKDDEITQITNDKNDIQDKYDASQTTLALGRVLQTSNLRALAIKIKSSGKQVETTRANRADMIKACFTILENKIAHEGNKDILMRIISPDGTVLKDSNPVYFKMADGNEAQASISRKVNYQNQNMDLCIYFEMEEEIPIGTYKVEIYSEGYRIGNTSFALK